MVLCGNRSTRIIACLALPVLAMAWHPGSAAAADPAVGGPRIRAVLVGAADFTDPSLPPLDGARNDAMLMAQTLLRRGAKAEDVLLLVDHPEKAQIGATVSPSGSPTRAEILEALARVAQATQQGDQVVVQLSGHGEQQREEVAGNEPDGRDETFLPIDARVGPNYVEHDTPIANAITDDEIGRALDVIRDRGGNVFFLADFCHSGDSTRGGSTAAQRRDRPLERTPDKPGRGALVAFYTARSDELGAQRAAPFWALGDADNPVHPHGVLSYYTITALNEPLVGTYDDLFERVNAYIQASNAALGGQPAALPAPDGATHLPVLGFGTRAAGQRGWSVAKPAQDGDRASLSELVMPAGALAGVRPGTVFSIARIGARDEVILYGRAQSVEAWSTRIVPISHDGISRDAWSDLRIPDPFDPAAPRIPFTQADTLFLRLVDQPVAGELDVILPRDRDATTPAQRAALAMLRGMDPGETGVRFVTRATGAALVLRFNGDAVEFVAGARPQARSYGRIALADGATSKEQLTAALVRASRFHRVQAVLTAQAAQPSGEDAPSALLQVQFSLRRPPAVPAGAPCEVGRFRPGDPVPADARAMNELGYDMATAPELRRCDEIYVQISNTGQRPVHVTPIILAPEGAIYFLPTQADARVLYDPGRTGTARYALTTDVGSEAGRDDLTFIVLDVDPTRQAPSIRRSLEQPGIVCENPTDAACRPDSTRGADPGTPEARALLNLLSGTRAAGGPVPRVGMLRYSWYTLPDDARDAR